MPEEVEQQIETPTPEETPTIDTPEEVVEEVVEAPAALTADDIEIPEGFEVAEEVRDKFLEVMNNAELAPNERANALIELQAETIRVASEKISEDWTKLREEWTTKAKSDPDYGGANFEANLSEIGKILNEFGDPGLREEVFDITGAGDHPLMFRFLSRVAKELSEGTPVQGNAPASDRPSLAERLYPSMKG